MNCVFRFGVIAWIVVTSVVAQSSAWLRVGGPDSRKIVSDASNSTPIVLTSAGHGFQEGDVVWVSFVNGNTAANGVRKIKSVTANSFAITDLQGKNITGNGNGVDFNPIKFPGIKGYVGKVQQSRIVDSPGMLLDGPHGALASQVRDPDGPGGGKAPKANTGWAPYAGLQRRIAQFVANPEKWLTSEAVTGGAIPHLAALDWYMDNSRTQSLAAAKYWVNNVDKFLSVATFSACDENYKHCGRGSFPDWMSFTSANMIYAYSLIRTELTPAERKAFADKMLNDQSDPSGCTNMLQPATGTVSIAAGTAEVSGVGTKFLTEYRPLSNGAQRWIKLSTTVGYPSWASIKSVDSDTKLTLAAVLSPSNSYQNIAHGSVDEWKAGSCGVKWFVSHHGSAPNIVAKRLPTQLSTAMSAADQKITVNSPGNFPTRTPFAIMVSGSKSEVMTVTAVQGNSFTVQRGQYGTAPVAVPAGTRVSWQSHPASAGIDFVNSQEYVPMDAPRHNLVMAKVYGYITLGMGLANDDPRAVELLQDSWNYYYDFQYPLAKAMWTGITQGGYAYGPNRWMDFTFRIAATLKNSVEPAIDITDGQWLKDLLMYPLYISLPYQPSYSMRFADSGSSELIYPRWMKHVLIGNSLFAGSTESGAANYWYHTMAKFYEPTRWYDADSPNSLAYALIFSSDKDKIIDVPQSIPPYYFFTQSDTNPSWNNNARYNAVVSRQNWNSDATYLWSTAFSQPGDHLGSYPGPGSYKILKNQYLIGENGSGTQGSGLPVNNNAVQIGDAYNLRSYNYEGGQLVSVDRQYGSEPYVYFRVNSINSYKNTAKLNYIYRHFVHLKTGAHDYVVVYDDANTQQPMEKISRVHYFADNNETPQFRYEGDLITFKRDKAMVSTRVVLPASNQKMEEVLSNRKPTTSETVHSVALNAGKNTDGEFLVIHRPSTNLSDQMPKTQTLDAGPSFRAAMILDQTPKVVLFARGTVSPQSVSFNIPSSSSENEVVIAGLAPGTYSVNVGGASVVTSQTVGSHGSLYFKTPSGKVTVTRVGVAQLEVAAERPPLAWTGTKLNFKFEAVGGQEPYRWVSKGTLPDGLNLQENGILVGTPVEAGKYSFMVSLFDATGSSIEFPIEVQVMGGENNGNSGGGGGSVGGEEPVSFAISKVDVPPATSIGEEYSFQLMAEGGAKPYNWKLKTGKLPVGLNMDTAGLISGTPVTPGSFSINVEVEDSSSSSQIASADYEIDVKSDVPGTAVKIFELPEGRAGETYLLSLPQASETPFLSGWLLDHGTLPFGLYMDSKGQLSGVPARAGVFTFSVRIIRQTGPIERFFMIKIDGD